MLRTFTKLLAVMVELLLVNRIAPEAQSRPQNSLNIVNLHSGHTGQSEALMGVSSHKLTTAARPGCAGRGLSGRPMPQPETYRYLFRLGLDTWEIARLYGVTEAEIYNYLANH